MPEFYLTMAFLVGSIVAYLLQDGDRDFVFVGIVSGAIWPLTLLVLVSGFLLGLGWFDDGDDE